MSVRIPTRSVISPYHTTNTLTYPKLNSPLPSISLSHESNINRSIKNHNSKYHTFPLNVSNIYPISTQYYCVYYTPSGKASSRPARISVQRKAQVHLGSTQPPLQPNPVQSSPQLEYYPILHGPYLIFKNCSCRSYPRNYSLESGVSSSLCGAVMYTYSL